MESSSYTSDSGLVVLKSMFDFISDFVHEEIMEFQEDFQSDDRHEVDDTLLVSSRDEAMKEQKYDNEEEEQEERELRDAFYMSGFPQPTDDGSEEPAEETHIQEPAKAVSAFENLGMLKMQEPSTLFYEAINNAMGTFAWKDEHKDEQCHAEEGSELYVPVHFPVILTPRRVSAYSEPILARPIRMTRD